jgi:hypothetical protein
MSKSKKPDFLIIGVQKSATTWLQKMLVVHPEIYMPNQEVHYFDNNINYFKGRLWYASFFKKARNSDLIGEKTPDYIWTNCIDTEKHSTEKLLRIKQFNPNIKLISIFRNPVDRFVSAFHHNKRRGRVPADLSVTSMLNNAKYSKILQSMLSRGLYGIQLEAIYHEFSKDKVKIIFHDSIKENPSGIVSDVFKFLGVPSINLSDQESKRYNVYQASKLGSLLVARSNNYLKSSILRFDKYFLSKLPIKKVSYPKLSINEKQILTDYYKKDMAYFKSLIDLELPDSWKF